MLPIISNLIFISAVLYSYFSGNDKAPFVVIGALVFALILIVISLSKKRWRSALLAAIPHIYFFIIILLGRMNLVDSQDFLGFR